VVSFAAASQIYIIGSTRVRCESASPWASIAILTGRHRPWTFPAWTVAGVTDAEPVVRAARETQTKASWEANTCHSLPLTTAVGVLLFKPEPTDKQIDA
jgi:hypothetical protein